MKTAKELMNSRCEGTTGVKNLAMLCNAIGYKDTMYFGQFDPNGSYGDLINFLEDNPGAVESIKEFIAENFVHEIQPDEEDAD